MRRGIRFGAASVVAMLALAGCGGDDDSATTTAVPDTVVTTAAPATTSAPETTMAPSTTVAEATTTTTVETTTTAVAAAVALSEDFVCGLLDDADFEAAVGTAPDGPGEGSDGYCAWTVAGWTVQVSDATDSFSGEALADRLGGIETYSLAEGTNREVWVNSAPAEAVINIGGSVLYLNEGFGSVPDGVVAADAIAELAVAIDAAAG